MSEEKESFVFYKSFYEALQDLRDKDRLKVYDAICKMALNNEDTDLNGISKTIFTLIKPQLLANNRRYENGKKGGRPNKKTIGFQKEKTIGFNLEETKTKPNVNDNDNVNVNVNVNDNVLTTTVVNNANDSCVDGLQEVIAFYENNIGLLTPFGLEILSDYTKELNKEIVIYAMKISVEANKRTIQYIKAILNNWIKAGIKTLSDAKAESNKKKNVSAEEEFLNEQD